MSQALSFKNLFKLNSTEHEMCRAHISMINTASEQEKSLFFSILVFMSC